jgi:DNA adenine methylase
MGAVKPFFRWLGSKAGLTDHIIALMPEKIDTYYEPFFGSGAVFLALAETGRIEQAVLGDGNPDVAQTIEAVRDDPHGVISALADINRELNRIRLNAPRAAAFYALARTRIREKADPPRLAALFLFLNQTAFNGLWRVNRAGDMNAPPDGARLAAWHPDPEPIKEASRLFKKCRASVHYGDFSQTIGPAIRSPSRRSALYLDPPYLSETSSGFVSYTSEPFRAGDFIDMMVLVEQAVRNGSRVVLSTSSHIQALSTLWAMVAEEQLPGAYIQTIQAHRRVAAGSEHRGYRGEILFAAGPRDGTWRA